MKQSKLFYKTLKQAPKDEESKNAQLLIRAGFIDKVMAGVYNYLPLGWRVLHKIENIIREEMDALGAQEMLMPVLHPGENWKRTGRWDEVDVLFKLKGAGEKDLVLGPTHEEIVTPLAKKIIFSYKDLPQHVYQIQTKFRNEARPRSGLIRGREFSMKDLYSFHATEKDLDNYYEQVEQTYERICERLGIGEMTYKTYASGGSFSKYSHEYQTLCTTGEDTIFACHQCKVAVNKDIIGELKKCPECGNQNLEQEKAIETSNIFKLKRKFSDAFDLIYIDQKGKEQPVFMGCYGFGLSRTMGTLAEIFNDKKGLIWPEEVAPFTVHLVNLRKNNKKSDKIYNKLISAGIDVLYDDRLDINSGEKLAEADLIGIPHRLVLSEKTGRKLEYSPRSRYGEAGKKRNEREISLVSLKEVIKILGK